MWYKYQSQETDNTFITSYGTSPYNSTRWWAKERHYRKNKNYKPNVEANYVEVISVLRHAKLPTGDPNPQAKLGAERNPVLNVLGKKLRVFFCKY